MPLIAVWLLALPPEVACLTVSSKITDVLSLVYRYLALPLVDIARRTDSIRVFHALDQSQWRPRAELEALQFRRLQDLVVHAARHVPYYRELFAAAGFVPEKMQSPDDLRVIPFLTKDILRREKERMLADNAAAFQPRPHRSAGTTGQPIIIQMDRMRHSIGWGDMYRWWAAGGWKLGNKQFVVAERRCSRVSSRAIRPAGIRG